MQAVQRYAVHVIFLLLASVSGIAAANTTATSINNTQFSFEYRIVNAWTGGFQGEIVLRNSSLASISDWSLQFNLDASFSNIWNAKVASQSSSVVQLVPVPWTTTVPVGGKITIGFVASGTNELTQVALLDPAMPLAPVVDHSAAVSDATVVTEPAMTITTPADYLGFGPSLNPVFNYGEALQMSWYFFEAQRSGPLPRFDGDLAFHDPRTGVKLHDGFKANRVPWRGDSGLDDGADVGIDLTGGWHDAGDHVKFGLPMAFSASFLAWGVIEFEQALIDSEQMSWAKDNLRWVADYFLKAHVSPNELYGQVGEGHVDHLIWGAPEVMPHFRPAFKIDMNAPGPDLAAQTSAALTAISMVFRADEPVYADVLLQRAIELYDFAQATRAPETALDDSLGRYTDSIIDARSFYASRAGAKDDLPYAGAWLYMATKEPRFLHDAEADYTRIADNTGHKGWTSVWDDVRYAVYVLMSKIHADPDYKTDSLITSAERVDGYFDYNLHAQNFFNHWLRDGGVRRTPGGMAWLTTWGSARYNTSTAFMALVYRKHLMAQGAGEQLQDNYLKFATEQVNYVLGDNPLNMSYVVGYGDNYSQYAHHRSSHGSSSNSMYSPALPRHILYGGLAGGPAADDSYTTDRSNYARTEVATDMNAGLAGVLAGLVDAYGIAGNEADPAFPPVAPEYNEIYVKAILQTKQPSDLATGVQVKIVNESAYPPRDSDTLKFRYFVDLSELYALGFTEEDLFLELYWNEGEGATLHRWKESAYIFYIEGSFVGTNITPIGQDKYQKNMEFVIRLPWAERGWNPDNDPSYAGLIADQAVVTDKIALYDAALPEGGQLIWGVEPDQGILLSELPAPGSDNTTQLVTSHFAISIDVYESWGAGHCSKITVTNTGSSPAVPTGFQFILPAELVVSTSWNGYYVRNGDIMDVTLPSYVGFMEPGASRTDFGYCANGTSLPTVSEPVVSNEPTAVVEVVISPLDVEVQLYNDWGGGFCADIYVTNNNDQAVELDGVQFVLASAVTITNSWNGAVHRNGDDVDVTLPLWVGEIQPGQTRKDFGFCATGSERPAYPSAY